MICFYQINLSNIWQSYKYLNQEFPKCLLANEFFFREQPVSIEACNNECKHKDNKISKKQQKIA